MHPAALDPDQLLAQCETSRDRASGPGGQHRNKVETRITLKHIPTGHVAQAGERRSAVENQRMALRRLRLILATELRTPVPAGDARSALWISRCHDGRIACNDEHQDFPAMLAEAMDNLWQCELDPAKAAARLLCTPSQLIKLLRKHPPAIIALNAARAQRGQHAIK